MLCDFGRKRIIVLQQPNVSGHAWYRLLCTKRTLNRRRLMSAIGG
jgi:hypothetical protein